MAKKAYLGIDNVARKVKKIYIGAEGALPSGYTQIEYIQSSGTQWIDTGFKHNQNTRVVMDVQPTSIGAVNAWAFEGRTSNSSAKHGVFFYGNSKGDSKWNSDYGGSSRLPFTGVDKTDRLNIDYNKNVCIINGVSVTHTTSTFQSTRTLSLLCKRDSETADSFLNAKLYSCKIYDNGVLIRNFVPCINSSGTVGMYDTVNHAFYGNAGSGVFTAGQLVEVGSVAHMVKKAYIGIGGVARPCFGGGELEYYGAITPLGTRSGKSEATSIEEYALFAGGFLVSGGSTTFLSDVTAYNKSLTRILPTDLSAARYSLAATSIGGHALFAGGMNSTHGDPGLSVVDAYDASLTRTIITSLSVGRMDLAATSVGDYALFAGGYTYADDQLTLESKDTVDAYNKSLTRTIATALSVPRHTLNGATVGNNALFAGGLEAKAGAKSTVDAYSNSLTRTLPTELSYATGWVETATATSNHALFGHGIINAYDKSLVRTIPESLSTPDCRAALGATSIGGYALFAGGTDDVDVVSIVDAYDLNLVKTLPQELSVARYSMGATTIGEYALFGGGSGASGALDSVEAYTII